MTVIGNTVVMVFEEAKMAHENLVKKSNKKIKR